MTAKELAQLLARQAENVCRLLLPNGKRNGHEWQVGSTFGEAGKSLCVRISGDKAGVWSDFADSGKGGDLLDLWREVRGIPLKEAITEVKAHLGVFESNLHTHKAVFEKPKKPPCQSPKNRVMEYLKNERKLSENTIRAYKVAEQNEFIVFPSIRDGELIRYKLRSIDDKHNCKTSLNSEPCLFGWQAIPDNAREVVICEGEIDAMSWYQLGYPALSVPNGAQGLTWIEHEYNSLERFDKIYLSMDMDDAGQKVVPEIVERLGRERVRVIDLPLKDANELLQSGFTSVMANGIILKAKTVDPSELRNAADFVDKVINEFYGTDTNGFYLPWEKSIGKIKCRYGETILLSGINKHGKSQAIGNIALGAIAQGEKACIASFEFKPEKWLKRLTRQAACLSMPTKEYIRAVHDWYRPKLWVFNVVGKSKIDKMFEVFSYARKRYGITMFVIDNLQKLDIDVEDNSAVKNFVERLTDFNIEHDCVSFLIHHQRKGHDESYSGKMGVKGSGSLTDLVDTILIWFRNKEKEKKRHDAEMVKGEFDESLEPDAFLYCEGQRNGDDEPTYGFWFDRESTQFVEYHGQRPKRYVNYSIVRDEDIAI